MEIIKNQWILLIKHNVFRARFSLSIILSLPIGKTGGPKGPYTICTIVTCVQPAVPVCSRLSRVQPATHFRELATLFLEMAKPYWELASELATPFCEWTTPICEFESPFRELPITFRESATLFRGLVTLPVSGQYFSTGSHTLLQVCHTSL